MIVGCCGDLLVGYKRSVRFVCFGFRCGSRFVSHESRGIGITHLLNEPTKFTMNNVPVWIMDA